jgi:diketogulonate reductase-like aldo/keto reductase
MRGITAIGALGILGTLPPEEQRKQAEHALAEAAAGRLVAEIGQTYPLERAADAHSASKYMPLPFHGLRKALDGSLEQLGVPTIDLYYLHFPLTKIETAMDQMAQAVQEGKSDVRQIIL